MNKRILFGLVLISLLFVSGFSEGVKYSDKVYDNYLDSEIVLNNIENNENIIENEVEPRRDQESQEIELNMGWNLISSYIIPEDLDIEVIFNDLVEEGSLIMVKDEQGRFFIPENDFNNIPEWNPQEGYYVKVNEDAQLVIQGEEYTPTEIQLEEGWNVIAYPLTESYDMEYIIDNTLTPLIEEDILIIMKNGLGNFFVPRWNFDNIREMRPGQGYMVNVNEDSVIDFSNHNSIIEDDIEYYVQTNKYSYNLREWVWTLYKVTNLRDEEVHFEWDLYPPSQYRVIRMDDGEIVFETSQVFWVEWGFTLQPGESIIIEYRNPRGRRIWYAVERGDYEVIGELLGYVSVTVPIEIV